MTAHALRIGVDLDNTIVCYDELFHRLALEHGWIPRDTPVRKTAVRAALRAGGREVLWTELQGEAYGVRMAGSRAYPGARSCLAACRQRGAEVCIISHRSRAPYRGPVTDLHATAIAWLEAEGFVSPEVVPLGNVHLELTRRAKVERIAALGCTHFIDDLEDVYREPFFPAATVRILFDPDGEYRGREAQRLASWDTAAAMIFA
jgi:phosphoglycolate phosphatase-like HAD superfamily hydrolase